MKIRSIFTVALLLALGIAACSDDHRAPQPKQQQSAEVDRLNRELQKAETNVSKQESAKAWWQSIATFLAVRRSIDHAHCMIGASIDNCNRYTPQDAHLIHGDRVKIAGRDSASNLGRFQDRRMSARLNHFVIAVWRAKDAESGA